MGLQFLIDFLKHQFTANTRHGTHSPFVYKLADEVIYDFSLKSEYKDVEAQRKLLLNDSRQITPPRNLAAIARKHVNSPRLAQLVYRLAKFQNPKSIIEIGANLGFTTAYLAKAQPSLTVISIAQCTNTTAVCTETLARLGLENVNIQVGDVQQQLLKAIAKTTPLGLVYFNSSDIKKQLYACFQLCLAAATEDTMFIIDDIYRNSDTKVTWRQIKEDSRVTVTVDSFWIGLVFFRKGQAKEHFKLKF